MKARQVCEEDREDRTQEAASRKANMTERMIQSMKKKENKTFKRRPLSRIID